MIARLAGTLVDLHPEQNLALVEPPGGGLIYEVLLPAYLTHRLSTGVGKPVTLHTLHFFESTAQGATMFPRLAGFQSADQKRFFELFVTVKGIGHKKAMRAMIMEPGTLAAAIADRDVKLLQTMPEVGKKLAETMVVTLGDKVDRFVSASAYPTGGDGAGDADAGADGGAAPARSSTAALARETLEVLLQLGENRADAVVLIDRVLAADDAPTEVDRVVAAVYALRAR